MDATDDNDPAFFTLNFAMASGASSSHKQRQAFTTGTSVDPTPRVEDIGVTVEMPSGYKLSQVTNPRSSFDQKLIEEQADEERERKKLIESIIANQKQYESSSSFFVNASIDQDDDDVDALLDAVAIPTSSTIDVDVEPQRTGVIDSSATEEEKVTTPQPQPQTANIDAGVMKEELTSTPAHVFNDEFHVKEDEYVTSAVLSALDAPSIDNDNTGVQNSEVIAVGSPTIDDMSSSFIMSPEGKELLIAASTLQRELNDQNDTHLTEHDTTHATESHHQHIRSRRMTDDTNLSTTSQAHSGTNTPTRAQLTEERVRMRRERSLTMGGYTPPTKEEQKNQKKERGWNGGFAFPNTPNLTPEGKKSRGRVDGLRGSMPSTMGEATPPARQRPQSAASYNSMRSSGAREGGRDYLMSQGNEMGLLSGLGDGSHEGSVVMMGDASNPYGTPGPGLDSEYSGGGNEGSKVVNVVSNNPPKSSSSSSHAKLQSPRPSPKPSPKTTRRKSFGNDAQKRPASWAYNNKNSPMYDNHSPHRVQSSPSKSRSSQKMVYDIHGRLVSEDDEFVATEELRIRKEELGLGIHKIEENFESHSKWLGKGKVFDLNGQLIQKTKEWATHHYGKLVDEVTYKERSLWVPMKLPYSTFPDKGMATLPIDAVKYWPEYDLMDQDDVIITIEHCSDCARHELLCHHDEDQYKQCAEDLRQALTNALKLFAVRYAVLIKPRKPDHNNMFAKGGPMSGTLTKGRNIKDDRWQLMPGMSQKEGTDLKSSSSKAQSNSKGGKVPFAARYNASKVMGVDYSHRMGSMEVQAAIQSGKTTGRPLVAHILYSKILHGVWPDAQAVGSSLVRLMKSEKMLQIKDEPMTSLTSPSKGKSKRNTINVNAKSPKPPPPPVTITWESDCKVVNRGVSFRPNSGNRSLAHSQVPTPVMTRSPSTDVLSTSIHSITTTSPTHQSHPRTTASEPYGNGATIPDGAIMI